LIPVEDKLATDEIDYSISLHNIDIRHFSTPKQTSIDTSNIRVAYYFHLAGKYLRWSNTIIIDCDECSTNWQNNFVFLWI